MTTITNEQEAAIKCAWEVRSGPDGMDYGKPTSAKYRKALADFTAGAMAALNAMQPHEDGRSLGPLVPAVWVFRMMRGDSPFDS